MGANSFKTPLYGYVIFNEKGNVIGVISSIIEAAKYIDKNKGCKFEPFILNDLLKR